MNIKDDGQTSRAEMMLKKIEETNFFQELSKKFKVRLIEFNQEARRIEAHFANCASMERERASRLRSNLLQQEMGTLPMTGVVLYQ